MSLFIQFYDKSSFLSFCQKCFLWNVGGVHTPCYSQKHVMWNCVIKKFLCICTICLGLDYICCSSSEIRKFVNAIIRKVHQKFASEKYTRNLQVNKCNDHYTLFHEISYTFFLFISVLYLFVIIFGNVSSYLVMEILDFENI